MAEMAAPTIDAVTAWLRNCSLEGGRGAAPLHNPRTAAELECLDSEEALSYHCEQCLDTRELYYSHADTSLWSSLDSSDEYTSDDAVIDEEDEEQEEANDGTEDSISASTGDERDYEYDDFYSSSNTTTSATAAFHTISNAHVADGSSEGIILVVAGCKSCFMYFMVPKCVEACPRCGGCLLHIGAR